MQKTDLLDEV